MKQYIVLSNLINTAIQHRQQLRQYFYRNGLDFQQFKPNFQENREKIAPELLSVLYRCAR